MNISIRTETAADIPAIEAVTISVLLGEEIAIQRPGARQVLHHMAE
jgi:predicted N-acetyltransferase YhbS